MQRLPRSTRPEKLSLPDALPICSNGTCRVFTLPSRPTILIDARRGGRRCDNKCNEPFCAIESPPQEVVVARAALEETGKGAELATFEAVRILGKERRILRRHAHGVY